MENKAKLKGYKLNPNYTPSAGDYLHIADWDYGEIEELVAMTPRSWWYSYESKLKYGFEGYEILLFDHDTFGTAATNEVPWGANHVTKSDILVPVEEAPTYNPENVVSAFNGLPFTCGNIKITVAPQHKRETPLKYTELWMADTSKDVMGVMSGYLTHGKYYEVLSTLTNTFGGLTFKVVTDAGYIVPYGACWFKPVRLYDEDEGELICRDIEFVEGDYIDLRKHTPEQIQHIAKFYKFFNVDTLFNSHVTYDYVIYSRSSGWSGHDRVGLNDKEYIYDDIFYSEES